MESEFARLAKFAAPPLSPSLVRNSEPTEAKSQGDTSGTNSALPASLAVAMTLTLLGAGVASYAGNVVANRSRESKREQSDQAQRTAPEMSKEHSEAPRDVVPAGQVPAPRSASTLAYIEPTDWMAAIERSYGVSTRAGPLHAVVSVAGARDVNEDYVCAFDVLDRVTNDTLHCMLVADGCGGHAGGREASCLAVRAASEESTSPARVK